MAWDRYKPRTEVHGWTHAKARKAWAARHHPDDLCVRCGHPLGEMGSWLHLDHHDWDKTQYLGFAHGTPCPTCGVRCNVSAAGRLGNARQHARRHGGQTGQTAYRL